MNGGGPTAQIVEREGWRQDKDFVGHRKAVTCVVCTLASRERNGMVETRDVKSQKRPMSCVCDEVAMNIILRSIKTSIWRVEAIYEK
jgi:hypothetical protein